MDKYLYQHIMNKIPGIIRIAKKNNFDLKKEQILNHFWHQIQGKMLKNHQIQLELKKEIKNAVDPLDIIYDYFLHHRFHWNGSILSIRKRTKSNREKGGKIYTPFNIIVLIVKKLQNLQKTKKQKNLENQHRSAENQYRIADIACGTGRFILEWQLQEKNSSKKNNPPQSAYFGYDTDEVAIDIAKKNSINNTNWINKDSLLYDNQDLDKKFDIILGNPPYIESKAIPDNYWKKLKENFSCAHKKFDHSVIFLERIIELLKPLGWCGIIISNKWLVSDYGLKIRKKMLSQTHIHTIINISQLPIFKNISTYPIIIIFQKKELERGSKHKIKMIKLQSVSEIDQIINNNFENIKINDISQNYFLDSHNKIILTDVTLDSIKFLKHFDDLLEYKAFKLGDMKSPYDLRKGIHTGNVKDKLFVQNQLIVKEKNNFKRAITSRNNVKRYGIIWKDLWVNYNPDLINKTNGDYGSLREQWIFESQPKIVIKLFGKRIQAALDKNKLYANNSLILLVKKHRTKGKTNKNSSYGKKFESLFDSQEQEFYYMLGLINSELISKYYILLFKHTHVRGNYLQYYVKDLSQIPIVTPKNENIYTIKEISKLAKKLEQLYKNAINTNNKKEDENEMSKTEEEIDNLVNFLYQIH